MKNSKTPNPFNKYQHHPDARKHQIVSFVKSTIRIVGYIYLPINLWVAALLLIMAEAVGIYEELV